MVTVRVECLVSPTEKEGHIMPASKFKGPLSLEDVAEDEAPVKRGGVDLTQFVELVTRSWQRKQDGQTNASVGVTIPADAASIVENRFRQAATQVGCGVNVATIEANDPRAANYGLRSGQVRMIVEARPKKAFPGRKSENGSATPAPAKAAAKK